MSKSADVLQAPGFRIVEEHALTFDDVLLIPQASSVLPSDVDLKTKLTRNISMNIPLVSAAMDTVTEHRLAIALAENGGIGIIHKNMDIETQARQVRRVKRYQAGVVRDPITILPGTTVTEIHALREKHGFSCFPVVDENSVVVGIVTSRDLRFVDCPNDTAADVMTPRENVACLTEKHLETKPSLDGSTSPCGSGIFPNSHGDLIVRHDVSVIRPDIQRLMRKRRVEKVLLVDPVGRITGLVTTRDFDKMKMHPNACVDAHNRLRCGAAVGCGAAGIARTEALVAEGVDVVVVDSSHGHSDGVLDMIKQIREKFPDLDIIGGNVATAEGARALIDAGCDAIKIGIGPGSICTTRIVTGVGVPQLTALANAVSVAWPLGIPVIADGGIRFSGDICKAISVGASCVMMGSMLAGTTESPGNMIHFEGRAYKSYRGMGSLGAMKAGSADRYFQAEVAKRVPEGIEGRVGYKGHVSEVVAQMTGGVRSCMGLTGSSKILDLQTKTCFYRITGAGIHESHVHNVQMTSEAPNYNGSMTK